MVLPVKIGIGRNTHLAHTVDISRFGARLAGFRDPFQAGTNVELQRGSRKAKVQVKWVSQLGSNEMQMGVESAEPLETFWGVDLAERERETKKEMDALMSLLSKGSKGSR